jgi:hypothetical protein
MLKEIAYKEIITGDPKMKNVLTSYIGKRKLTMRILLHRFKRLINAFSKKVKNHDLAVALYFMYYNFMRIHKTLRVTLTMTAGVTNKLWYIINLERLLEYSL